MLEEILVSGSCMMSALYKLYYDGKIMEYDLRLRCNVYRKIRNAMQNLGIDISRKRTSWSS
jgi:hypothetical protein